MRQNIKEKILELFYENPDNTFTVREISRLTNIPRATAHKYIKQLKSLKLIDKDNRANNNLLFKTMKINFFVEKIVASGIIMDLVDTLNPSCIMLFGSIRKGDSVKDSDIDIFIEAPIKKDLDLNIYEKKLKHKIQLFVEERMDNLQPNLYNNIINGIKLYGGFKVK